ncbi:MAG: MBL fold metallo-hydrolase [Bacteroidales bacterium]|nr:MBL fold metallo-hydrolase [Bacteroidales bacterium]
MIKIKYFFFNAFQVNTFILYDETKECVIIDPGCYEESEESALSDFIEKEGLKPVKLLNTHCHIDHILGNNFICKKYNLKPEIHKAGLLFLNSSEEHASMYGFKMDKAIEPDKFIAEGDIIKFGTSELYVIYTPGHADGSVCFINKKQKFVIVGDVLFKESIGRTDFPTGDYNLLINSIKNKLYILDDDFIVYTGHGPETSIGYEKQNNLYVNL